MRKTTTALTAVLAIGLVSVWISHRLFVRVGRPDVLVQVVRDIDDPAARVVRLTNTGDDAKKIDLAGLEYFLYVPADDATRLIVQIQARRFFHNPRDRLERETGAYTLRPRDVADIKDVAVLLRGVPVDGARLGVILSCYPPLDKAVYWQGFARSAFLPLDTR